jgi:hypothetical protein
MGAFAPTRVHVASSVAAGPIGQLVFDLKSGVRPFPRTYASGSYMHQTAFFIYSLNDFIVCGIWFHFW